MAFINWGNESDAQKKFRRFLEEQALMEQAINSSQGRSGQAPGVGGGSLLYKNITSIPNQHSTLVITSELNHPTYRYYVSNYFTGNILGPFDTEVSVEDYSLNDLYSYPLQYSGYGLRFYRGDINEHTLIFLDYSGMVVEKIVAISTDVNMETLQGKYIVATDYDNDFLWIFDGTTLLTDVTTFSGINGFNIGSTGSYSATAFGFVLSTFTLGEGVKYYFCNSNSIAQIYSVSNEQAMNSTISVYVMYDSDKFVVMTRNNLDNRLSKVEILSSNGAVQHLIEIDTEVFDHDDFTIYGSNKFIVHINNSSNAEVDRVVYYYDGSTGLMHETALSGETYSSFEAFYRQRQLSSAYDYPIVENAVFWFLGSTTNENGLSYSNEIAALRFFEGQPPSLYTYAEGITKGVYLSDSGISRNFSLFVTDQNNDGTLNAMVIKETGAPVFSSLNYNTDGLVDLGITEVGERIAVVIEYNGPESEINTIVHSFNSSGTKAVPKLELTTNSHTAYRSYGVYLITDQTTTNFLTPSGSWAQYPYFLEYAESSFHTNSNQTSAPYYAAWKYNGVAYTHTQLNQAPEEGVAPEDFIMDGAIENGATWFGSGSTYFTNLYPGLFVLVAKSVSLTSFSINGNIGADGDGQFETETLPVLGYSKPYTAYVKKVYDSGDPSINHIIIIDTDGTGVVQTTDLSNQTDYHNVSGIEDATEIHYLLFAKTPNEFGYVSTEEVETVISAYLDLVDGQSLATTLSTLNSNYSNITDVFPAYDSEDPDRLYYFSDQYSNEGPNTISDGGSDMYDGANMITTNSTSRISLRAFKSNGEVRQIALPEFDNIWFGRNGFFITVINEYGNLTVMSYDLNGNLTGESDTTHPFTAYANYIEDRGIIVTEEKYFNPEEGLFYLPSRLYMIHPKGMEYVALDLAFGENKRVISNDWGQWND